MDCTAIIPCAYAIIIIIGHQQPSHAVKYYNIVYILINLNLNLNKFKVKKATYGEDCSSISCDPTVYLTCNSASYCVCSSGLFWNGSLCSNLKS